MLFGESHNAETSTTNTTECDKKVKLKFPSKFSHATKKNHKNNSATRVNLQSVFVQNTKHIKL